jgi:hypothetical protein
VPSSDRLRPGSGGPSPALVPHWCDRGIAPSIIRASTRAVASPIGWVRSQVVERSMTPICSPETGSCSGAAQQTQLWTIGA